MIGGDNKRLKILHTRSPLYQETRAYTPKTGTPDPSQQAAHLVEEKAQTFKSQAWTGHKLRHLEIFLISESKRS